MNKTTVSAQQMDTPLVDLYTNGLSQTVLNIIETLNLRLDVKYNKTTIEEFILRAIDQRYINFASIPYFINYPLSFTVLARHDDINKVSAFILPKNIYRFHRDLNLCFLPTSICPLPNTLLNERNRTIEHLIQNQLMLGNPTRIRYHGFPDWFSKYPVDGYMQTAGISSAPSRIAPNLVLDEKNEIPMVTMTPDNLVVPHILDDDEKKVLIEQVSDDIIDKIATLTRMATYTQLVNNNWWVRANNSDPRDIIKLELINHKRKSQLIIDSAEELIKKLDKLDDINGEIPSITFLEGKKYPNPQMRNAGRKMPYCISNRSRSNV
jgi:hypothetical protein